MFFHLQVKQRGDYLFLSPEIMNMATISEIEILFFNEHNILCYVTYLGIEEVNKDPVTLHSDMKPSIFILFQTILKSSTVKELLKYICVYV